MGELNNPVDYEKGSRVPERQDVCHIKSMHLGLAQPGQILI